jgi:hypothetical protein
MGKTQPSPGRYGGQVAHAACASINQEMRQIIAT